MGWLEKLFKSNKDQFFTAVQLWNQGGTTWTDACRAAGIDAGAEAIVKDRATAHLVVGAIYGLAREPERYSEPDPSLLGGDWGLLDLLLRPGNRQVEDVWRKLALPLVGIILSEHHRHGVGRVLVCALIGARYQDPPTIKAMIDMIKGGWHADEFYWENVFSEVAAVPGLREAVICLIDEAGLPKGFCGVAFLDLCNRVALEGSLEHHPYDSEGGVADLRILLDDHANPSYGLSAATAISFLADVRRSSLLPVALRHPSGLVRIEGAWAAARNGDQAGIDALAASAADPRHGGRERAFLEDLGASDRIPACCSEADWQSLSEMARWLALPSEYGRAPDSLHIVGSMELFWPPTRDRRRLWAIGFRFQGDDEVAQGSEGVGLVGSVTFALQEGTTLDLPLEDILGLHCCWELEMKGDQQSKPRSARRGRAIIAAKNPTFPAR